MRRIVAAVIALAVTGLVIGYFTGPGASPASAAVCAQRNLLLDVPNYTYAQVNHDPKVIVYYEVGCNGDWARITGTSYQLYVNPEDCGADGDGNNIAAYRLNVNAIGGWDPLMKTWTCRRGDDYRLDKDAPADTIVERGDPAAARCAAADFTIDTIGDFDIRRSSSSKCINFTS